jgi:hypothetical protein
MTTPKTDVRITDHGSIVALRPRSEEAWAWFDANVQSESWQWMGESLCIEPRYAQEIVYALRDEGFEVAS